MLSEKGPVYINVYCICKGSIPKKGGKYGLLPYPPRIPPIKDHTCPSDPPLVPRIPPPSTLGDQEGDCLLLMKYTYGAFCVKWDQQPVSGQYIINVLTHYLVACYI